MYRNVWPVLVDQCHEWRRNTKGIAVASDLPVAKPHLRIDGELEDRELLQRLLRATANALPVPKPKPARRKSKKPAS